MRGRKIAAVDYFVLIGNGKTSLRNVGIRSIYSIAVGPGTVRFFLLVYVDD